IHVAAFRIGRVEWLIGQGIHPASRHTAILEDERTVLEAGGGRRPDVEGEEVDGLERRAEKVGHFLDLLDGLAGRLAVVVEDVAEDRLLVLDRAPDVPYGRRAVHDELAEPRQRVFPE